MKTFNQYYESIKNKYFSIYFRRYYESGRHNISDIYYDIEQANRYNIEYVLFNNTFKGDEFFYLYLFPCNEYEYKIISSELIGMFNISSITNEDLKKEENIELIKKNKNANIINLEDVNLIISSKKFNI